MTPDLFAPDSLPQPGDLPDEHVERRALVALSLVPGVGPGRVRSLLARFGSATAVMRARVGALAEVRDVGPATARAITSFDDRDAVDEQFTRAADTGAELVPLWDDRIPALLREIYDPPSYLWVRGAFEEVDRKALAIVGTRRCTDYGRRAARQFAAELVREGFTIVSGLAYGIDRAAHEAVLEAGGRTVAVLGSGVDRIYPARHTKLAREIVARGAVVSEFPMGTGPDAANFPRRNRIVSGMTLGTLVVEAYESGGALITARLAVEQDREVFAVPHSIHNEAGRGANHLIQRGHAKLVQTVDDVLEELEGIVRAGEGHSPAPAAPDLNAVEQRLYDVLGLEPMHIDELSIRAEVDASSALVYLLSLEFKGLVRQLAGRQFFRVG